MSGSCIVYNNTYIIYSGKHEYVLCLTWANTSGALSQGVLPLCIVDNDGQLRHNQFLGSWLSQSSPDKMSLLFLLSLQYFSYIFSVLPLYLLSAFSRNFLCFSVDASSTEVPLSVWPPESRFLSYKPFTTTNSTVVLFSAILETGTPTSPSPPPSQESSLQSRYERYTVAYNKKRLITSCTVYINFNTIMVLASYVLLCFFYRLMA